MTIPISTPISSFLSLLFSLDCELLEGKDSLSCSGPFLVPMNTNLPNNNPTQIPHLHTLKRNGTNELIYETDSHLENELMVAGGQGKDGEKGS